MITSTPNEPEYLISARAGNSDAFTALVEPYRKPLLVHCYRMSGSLDDAEDLVQETFIRAWSKLNSFDGQGSFRNWLYVIATRLWLDEFRKRKKQILLPLDGDPADPDSPPLPPTSPASWLDPLPDSWLSGIGPSPEFSYERRETISLAFMVALQKLNARQRVVLLMREVFNWSADDAADALGLTVDSINNLLYRARKNLEASSYEETSALKQNLDQFVHAWESGDVHSLIKLLHEKATFAMPPLGVWYEGRESIQRALQNFVFMPNIKWKLIPTSANGNPAFGIYRGEGENYQAFGLLMPIFAEDKVGEVTAFLSPQLVTRFGLPTTLSF
ncbi:MAG: RNA polymerase subunit sigma-70 [Anaerolineales bacterium]|nr:RNA polymerase subunit sigma-70 [Anaerolineales bacterium]